ncbi:unnamed protein product [Eruca vesicaria subsp. sativa]|uniref:Uncharacterized protein n=1 Tax=Eruca vesicaria subsp. sativa TaxID=29727 RepID=A0ABC8KHB5_ERUVS|nr:unnamed protein product [Eruca vesicaria subsp. sativa]
MKGGKSKTETRSSKLSVAKKPAKAAGRGKAAAKDPNKPKRPASAFFVFIIQSEHVISYSRVEEGPKEDEEESDKSVSEVNDEEDADDGSDEEEDDD